MDFLLDRCQHYLSLCGTDRLVDTFKNHSFIPAFFVWFNTAIISISRLVLVDWISVAWQHENSHFTALRRYIWLEREQRVLLTIVYIQKKVLALLIYKASSLESRAKT